MSAPRRAVIGVHDGHNASACLLIGDELRYAVQEERLTGCKNASGPPRAAIGACLAQTGRAASAVDLVFASLRHTPARHRSVDQRRAFLRDTTPWGHFRRLALWLPYYRLNADLGWRDRRAYAAELGFDLARTRRFDHHLCHAATAYFGMRRDSETPHLVITADGYGDLESSTVWIGERNRLRKIASSGFGDSLGTLYGLVTGAMGFVPLEHEYKLMGMAPYAAPGHARALRAALGDLLRFDEATLSFRRRTLRPTIALHHDILELIKGHRFDDVCAALQQFTEEMLVALVRAAVRKSGVTRVVCAGGVFMNVKANQRLAELPEVEDLAIFPSPGDETLAIGACYLAQAESAPDGGSSLPPVGSFYLGDDVDEASCRAALSGTGYEVSRCEDLECELASLLAAGRIVARCKGRMEFGARALGNRSILADPAKPDAVRVINRMIKKRDFWMPFAPIVRRARVHDYFDNPKDLPSPHMMLTFATRDNFHDLIAAVHNADLTARPQILEANHNLELDRLLRRFEEITGRGVLLNTSFNLHGSPIVRGPVEALAVFRDSDLEVLNLGPYLVAKRGQRLVPSKAHAGRRAPAPGLVELQAG